MQRSVWIVKHGDLSVVAIPFGGVREGSKS